VPFSPRISETPLRVRYAETDAQGVAHHSSYVTWLEVARVEWLRTGRASYAELERSGYVLPVIELRIRYVAPARFDDALRVRACLTDVRSRSVSFVYEVVTDEAHPRQLANGMTRHICLLDGRVSPLPATLRELVDGRLPG
jgi:acyl-CoA thioester hydrolase